MSTGDRLVLAFLGLHPDRLRSLVERFGSAGSALAAVRSGKVEGVDPSTVWSADRCQNELDEVGARAVMLGDDSYPGSVAAIADPPDIFFVRGVLPERPGVAVVGTRRCTAYGRHLARSYGRAIAWAGWALISGLARGIDGEAHSGSLEAGGVGVAVLGSGIDVIYPREHAPLLEAIIDGGGAVVTEYPPGAAPLAWRFPPRNRIISALSGAVVVVESAVTGGALVTASRAAEQGRVVFATPGDVGRSSSVGCNLLIRDGAIPVLDSDDLVEALSLVMGPPALRQTPRSDDGSEVPMTGVSIDEFGAALGLDGSALLAMLGRLEVEGRIVRRGDMILPAT